MRIKLLEPFYTGSHKQWAEGLQQHSRHDINVASLSGNHWKWRMHGSAVSFSQNLDQEDPPDLLLCTDMLDVASFKGLLPPTWSQIPLVTYFHENQLTYPWSATDPDKSLQRDHHYGWINYTTALASDALLFNSEYHRSSFIEALPEFLHTFPDNIDLDSIESIADKSSVLHLGLGLEKFDSHRVKKIPNRILWNHRWEYDKNPESFFNVLFRLADDGIDFELAVCGERFSKEPSIFQEAKDKLKDRIVHFDTISSFEDYAKLVWSCGIIPITSNQDFFGISAVEAMYCQCTPLFPNRLAFPELVNNQAFLYNDDSQLQAKLQVLLRASGATDHCRENAARYDWSLNIDTYDAVLQSITEV